MNSAIHVFNLQPYLQQDVSDAEIAKRHWDSCHLAAAVQGLANRDAPRLYLRAIQPADDYWWEWMCAPGGWLSPIVFRACR